MPLNVMLIMGTRPEAIKLAPVIQELRRRPERFALQVAVTAQHRQMLDQVLQLFDIVPDYDLDIMRPGQTVSQVAGRVLLGLEPVLSRRPPDLVMVQGDTTTVMSAALAAYHLKVPVAHVEAGLRSHDKLQPFPEEVNRRIVSQIADWHFAPTDGARANLLAEGIAPKRVVVTGNTVVDALLSIVRVPARLPHPLLSRLDYAGRRVILVTTHRRENWGQPLRDVCQAIQQIVSAFPEVEVVYSVHPNPEVQRVVRPLLAGLERVHLLEPLDYATFAHLMQRCYLILTDSGGIQEEAPSLNVPVLVLRNVTERPEGLAAGTLKVVGTCRDVVVRETTRLLTEAGEHARMASAPNPYGDGLASRRIAEALAQQCTAGRLTAEAAVAPVSALAVTARP